MKIFLRRENIKDLNSAGAPLCRLAKGFLCIKELIQVWKSPRVTGKAELFDYFETFNEKHTGKLWEKNIPLGIFLICCGMSLFVFENTIMPVLF